MMNTISIDSKTYEDLVAFAALNKVDMAEIVRKSLYYFIESFGQSKAPTSDQLPDHLKRMRGILAGVEDKDDEKLNHILEK